MSDKHGEDSIPLDVPRYKMGRLFLQAAHLDVSDQLASNDQC